MTAKTKLIAAVLIVAGSAMVTVAVMWVCSHLVIGWR